MSYRTQPRKIAQCDERVFRPVPNPRRDDPWPADRAHRLATRLEDLFNRQPTGWPTRDMWLKLRPILPLIAFGRVRFRLIRLPREAAFQAAARSPGGTRAESAEHARMKLTAIWWMKATGASDACAECVHVAGRSDACSIKTDWIVECGHTRMGKLVDAIEGMPRGRFTLIPYQPLERWDQTLRPLLAVDFTWDEDASADVAEIRQAERSAIANEMRERMISRLGS